MNLPEPVEAFASTHEIRNHAARLRRQALDSVKAEPSNRRAFDLPYLRATVLEQAAELLDYREKLHNLRDGSVRHHCKSAVENAVSKLCEALSAGIAGWLCRLDAAIQLIEGCEALTIDSSARQLQYTNWLQLAEKLCDEVKSALPLIATDLGTIREFIDRGQTTIRVSRCCP